MATAKIVAQDKKRVEKTVLVPVSRLEEKKVVTYEDQPNRIQLDLSLDEALTLVLIGVRVGGMPSSTRRGDVDKISDAIRATNASPDFDWDRRIELAKNTMTPVSTLIFTGR